MDQKETLSVFGLGKLGATMLSCFAYKGWNVIGVDVIQDNVNAINENRSPISEPHVDSFIKLNKEKIRATTDARDAVLNSDVSFIIVPTPSESSGLFSTKYVEMVCKDIAETLKEKDNHHIIVITSTVLMGDTERIGKMIEEISGKKMGKDFGLVYNPEFIALGRIVKDFLNPDIVLIGESDEWTGNFLESIHKRLTDNEPLIHRMNFYNAELSKISLNAFCTLKITFANTIAEICEKLPGGDSEKVLQAIGSDTRIGNKYFKGGLGYGGPCLLPEGLVQTDEGLKQIKDIKIGDRVFTHKGRLRRVTQIYKRPYYGSMIKIQSMGFPNSPIIVTPDHPVWGYKHIQEEEIQRIEELEFIPAYKIKPGDITALPFINEENIEIPNLKINLSELCVDKEYKESKMVWINENRIYNMVKLVEETHYDGYVHNLEVEEDNSYMLESGVVHNCFPRDNRALFHSAEKYGIDMLFCKHTDDINNYHKTARICKLITDIMDEKGTEKLAVLGLAYKEDTPIIEESVAIEAIKLLSSDGIKVTVYDPEAMDEAKKELGENIIYADSAYSCLEGQSICFIATPWKEFGGLKADKILGVMAPNPIILDAWGILPFGRATSIHDGRNTLIVRRIGENYK